MSRVADNLIAMLTTKQVAERLGVTDARVRQLAIGGKLYGEKYGRDWLFDENDVADYLTERDRAREK